MFKCAFKLLSVLKNIKIIFTFFKTDSSLRPHLNILSFNSHLFLKKGSRECLNHEIYCPFLYFYCGS